MPFSLPDHPSGALTNTFEEAAAASGDLYLSTTGEISLGSGEALNALLENPVDNAWLHITRIASTATAGPVWAYIHENPTTDLPTTGHDVINADRSKPDSAVTLKADAQGTNLSGGAQHVSFGLGAGNTVKEEINLLVPPGATLGLYTDSNSGTLSGESASMAIWFVEIAN